MRINHTISLHEKLEAPNPAGEKILWKVGGELLIAPSGTWEGVP